MGPYLFEDASTAVRNASMRRLLELGAEANDLRALDDLVTTLARVPVEAWEDRPVKRRGHRGRRRRAAAELRERAAARGRRGPQSSESESESESEPESAVRRITIRSGSTVTSTWRWSAQCSA